MSDLKRKPHLWCLYGFSDKRLIEGLLFDEARAIISSLSATELEAWLVWREDWPDWRPVNDVEGLTEMIFRNLMAAPPPIPSTSTMADPNAFDGPQGLEVSSTGFTGTHSDDEEVKLTDSVIQLEASEEASNSGQFVVRKNRRFKKRYEITIMVGDKTFETHSLDISVGGILLEDTLPDWVDGNFKVRIRKPNIKQQIELTACLIEVKDSEQVNRVGILPLQSGSDEKNLENWLAA